MNKRKAKVLAGDVLGLLFSFAIFVIPFIFILLTSLKSKPEANLLRLTWPSELHFENYLEVIRANNYLLLKAFKNSLILTAGAVVFLVITGALAGYVLARRKDRASRIIRNILTIGLMVPVTIMPTIWVMKALNVYRTMFGMIMVETAINLSFTIMLYRGFVNTVPLELEEAGYIDGCNKFQMFGKIIFPLLKPVTSTVIILNAIAVFNDFTNPLYFLPGSENATVQLTLSSFSGRYASANNLLFADILLITVPMLILFLIFNKKSVSGMASGAVKG